MRRSFSDFVVAIPTLQGATEPHCTRLNSSAIARETLAWGRGGVLNETATSCVDWAPLLACEIRRGYSISRRRARIAGGAAASRARSYEPTRQARRGTAETLSGCGT